MSQSTTHSDPAVVQAAAWISRLDGAPDRGWDDPEFLGWMAQADSHRLAFAELSALWFGADELDLPVPSSVPAAVIPTRPTSARRWRVGGLAVVLLALALLPDWGWLWLRSQADFSAPRGTFQSVPLSDGSKLQLAGDSAVRKLKSGRGVELLRGELVLDVVADADRPFRVVVDNATVTVIGTRFGVTRRDKTLRVGVMEGQVAVQSGTQTLALEAGQQVVMRNGALLLDDVRPGDFFSWSRGRLVFRNRSLPQVIARLQPFTTRQIWLSPGAQGGSLSAVVALDGADRVVASLAQQAGLELTTLGPVDVLH